MVPFGVRLPIIEIEKKVIKEEEFNREVKTKKVLIDVDVLNRIFKYFLAKGRMEAACLLRGLLAGGEYLLIKDAHLCEDSTGDRAYVDIQPIEFSKADKRDGYRIVGWCHSHPSYGVFLSGTDADTQVRYFQSFFPDAVAMVMDPLGKIGPEYKFFRVLTDRKKTKEIPFDYLVRRDEDL